MLKIDKDYENAIRSYLDKSLGFIQSYDSVESFDLNIIKPFTAYIRSLAPKDFVFSTPMFGWWDLTSACNFRCIHCLYSDRDYSDKNDLTTQEALNLADELINDFHICCITLTGGEIFLRKDTIDIIRKFKENNISVHLATNAALLDDNKINELAEILDPHLDFVQVSLDGATYETFKKIRQTDCFDKIINNIKKMAQKGISVLVACTANKFNANEIEDLYRICCNLGVKTLTVGRMVSYNETQKTFELSDKECVLLSSKLYNIDTTNKKTELKPFLLSTVEMLNIPEVAAILEEEKYSKLFESRNFVQQRECNLHDRISIRSDGRIYMCMQAETCKNALMGNYRENSLLEIWEKRSSNIMFQPRSIEGSGCEKCKYNSICTGGCKVKSYNKFGDINLPELKCIHAKR